MGLTGIIVRASFKLQRVETAYIKEEILKAKNLEEITNLFDQSRDFTYSVAWIDLLAKGDDTGRSVLMRGEHAKRDEAGSHADPLTIKPKRKISVPFNLPGFFLNSFSVKAFNSVYYQRARSGQTLVKDYDSFFYPLDAIENWNRMYGKKGFMQYQLVFPKKSSVEGLRKILERVSEEGRSSFLAVIKLFGKQNDLISFPMEGYTLTMDFPVRPGLERFLVELDAIVLDHGGRLYLTKDARMSGEFFRKTYKRAEEFIKLKNSFDPDGKFASLQSKRLGI
ncbi:MAG: FAD-binding protein, partial [Nitrospinota bacterium]